MRPGARKPREEPRGRSSVEWGQGEWRRARVHAGRSVGGDRITSSSDLDAGDSIDSSSSSSSTASLEVPLPVRVVGTARYIWCSHWPGPELARPSLQRDRADGRAILVADHLAPGSRIGGADLRRALARRRADAPRWEPGRPRLASLVHHSYPLLIVVHPRPAPRCPDRHVLGCLFIVAPGLGHLRSTPLIQSSRRHVAVDRYPKINALTFNPDPKRIANACPEFSRACMNASCTMRPDRRKVTEGGQIRAGGTGQGSGGSSCEASGGFLTTTAPRSSTYEL